MAGHIENDKLLVHCFQESRTRSAVRWYMKLDHNQICAWKDLIKAFLTQYEHVVDTTPDRMSLMSMEKKNTKSFKKYA